MILEQLGIFGWKEADENLVLASLLTGDPLLLIGNHGCGPCRFASLTRRMLRILQCSQQGGAGPQVPGV